MESNWVWMPENVFAKLVTQGSHIQRNPSMYLPFFITTPLHSAPTPSPNHSLHHYPHFSLLKSPLRWWLASKLRSEIKANQWAWYWGFGFSAPGRPITWAQIEWCLKAWASRQCFWALPSVEEAIHQTEVCQIGPASSHLSLPTHAHPCQPLPIPTHPYPTHYSSVDPTRKPAWHPRQSTPNEYQLLSGPPVCPKSKEFQSSRNSIRTTFCVPDWFQQRIRDGIFRATIHTRLLCRVLGTLPGAGGNQWIMTFFQ